MVSGSVAIGSRGRAFIRTAFAVAMLAAAGTGAAAQEAPGGDPVVFSRLYQNPADVELNLLYAQTAETRGEHRKALATYERVLLIDPTNARARAGLARTRNLLAPNFTNFTLSIGGGYESNPLQRPDAAPQRSSGFGFAELRMRDERRIGGTRWRTHLAGGLSLFSDASEVNDGFVAGDVGPLFQATPGIAVRPSVVAGWRALDGTTLFAEIGAALELEGYLDGALQAVRLAAVWRDYGEAWVSDGGLVVDLSGRFARQAVLFDRDTIVFRPGARYSDVDNQGAIFVPADFAPGRYFQIGARLDYFYAFTDTISAGAHFAIYQRWYDAPGVPGGPDREDTYLSPGASITFGNVLLQAVDFVVVYRYEDNLSNVDFREFDNHVVAARFDVRF